MVSGLRRLAADIRRWNDGPLFWLIVLAVVMSVGGLAALWGSRRVGDWSQGVLVEIGITFLDVVLTVFLVGWFSRRHDQARWAPLSQQANLRLRTIATNLLLAVERHHPDHGTNPEFDVPAWAIRADQRHYLWRLYDNPRWVAHIRHRVLPDAVDVLEGMSPEAIDDLVHSLGETDRALREVISLYGLVLSPRQLDAVTGLIDLIPSERSVDAYLKGPRPTFPRPLVRRYFELALTLLEESPAKIPEEWQDVVGPGDPGDPGVDADR